MKTYNLATLPGGVMVIHMYVHSGIASTSGGWSYLLVVRSNPARLVLPFKISSYVFNVSFIFINVFSVLNDIKMFLFCSDDFEEIASDLNSSSAQRQVLQKKIRHLRYY
jgi:hypothetical protein